MYFKMIKDFTKKAAGTWPLVTSVKTATCWTANGLEILNFTSKVLHSDALMYLLVFYVRNLELIYLLIT